MGVNAPGSPTMMTLRPPQYSTMFTNCGGKPQCTSTNGNLSPGLIAAKAAVSYLLNVAELTLANKAAARM